MADAASGGAELTGETWGGAGAAWSVVAATVAGRERESKLMVSESEQIGIGGSSAKAIMRGTPCLEWAFSSL
jgi:hypothetical protein